MLDLLDQTSEPSDEMSYNFTYALPNEAQYFKAVLLTLKKKGHTELYNLLKNARCSISASSSFSRRRWDAMYTTVTFQLPMDDFDKLNLEDIERLDRNVLIGICDDIMPLDAGLDIMHVEFSPLLETVGETKTLEDDLQEITEALQGAAADFALPSDIMDKGQQMAEVYLYLYAVENYMRLFIEKVCIQAHGDEYFDKLNVPNSIANVINARKKQEAKNQWISMRGDSELFYLDFKDLGILIQNNWDLFKAYFPDQSWIASKIDELGNCRNLVAHNSFISEHERDVIRVNFRSIVKQLNPFMK